MICIINCKTCNLFAPPLSKKQICVSKKNFRLSKKLRILTGIYDVAGSGTFERATSSLQEVARSNVLPPRSSFDPDTNLRFQGNFRVAQKLRILTGIYDVAGSGTFEHATSSLEVARSSVLPPRSSYDPYTNLRLREKFSRYRETVDLNRNIGHSKRWHARKCYLLALPLILIQICVSREIFQEVARSSVLPRRSSYDPYTNLRLREKFSRYRETVDLNRNIGHSKRWHARKCYLLALPLILIQICGNFRVAQKLRILTGIYDVAGSGTFERATSSLQEVARSNVLPPRSSFDPDTNLRFQGNFRVAQKLRILTGIYDVAGSGTFERATSSLQEVARSNVLPPRSSFDPDTNLRFQGNFRVAQKLRILTGIYDVAGSGTFERATSSLQEVARSNVLPPRSSFDPDTNLRFQGNFRVAQKLRILTGIYDVAGSGTFERATSSLQEVARSNVLPPRSSFDPDTNLRFQGNFRVAQKLRILTGIYDVAGSGTFERATSSLQEVARSNVLPPRSSFDPDTNLRFQGNFRVAQKLRILTGIYDVAGSGTFERATSSLQEVARSNVLPPRSSFDPDTNLRFQGNFRVAQKLRILTGIYDVAGSGTFERATSSLQEVARSNVLPPRSSFDPDTNLRFQGNFRVAQKLRILTGIYDVAGSGTFERATSSLQEVARSKVLPPRSSFDPDTNLRFQGNFRVAQKLRILTGIYDVAGSGTFERATSSLQEVARSKVLPPRSSFDPDTNLRFQGNFRVAQKLRILTGIYDVAGSGTFERATSSLQEVARSNVLPPRSSFDPDTNLRFQGNFRVAQKLRILTGIYDVAGSGTFERATSSLQEVARSNVLPPRSSFDPDTNLRFQGNFRVAQKLRILTGIYDVAGSGTFERATSSLQEVARSNVLPPRSSFDPDTNLRFQGNFRVAQKLRILTGIYDVAGSGTFERATSSLQEVARSNVLPPRSSFDPDTNLRFQGNFRVVQKLRILTGIYDVAGSGTFERATSSLQEVARSNVLPPRSSFDPDTNLRFQGNFRVAQKLRILTGIYDVAGSGTFERATSSLQEVARSNVLPPRSSFDPDTNLRFQGNFRVAQKLRILTGIYDVAGSGTFERATSSLQEVARSNVLPPRSSFDPDTNLRFQGNFRVAQKLRILTGIYDVAGSGTFERATSSLQEVARSNVLPPRSSFDPDTNLRFQGNFRVAQKLRILTGIYDVAGSGTFERATSSLQEVARSNVLPPRSSFDPDTNLRFQGNFRVAQKLRILTGIYDVAGSGTFERATSSLQEVARSKVLPPRSSFDPDTNLRFQGNFRVAQKLRILTGIYDVAGSGTFERATSSLQEVARSKVLPPRSSFDPDTNLRFQGNFRVAQKLRILTGIYDVAGSGTFERATSSLQEVARSNVLPPRSSFDPDTNLRFQGNFRVAQKLRILTGIYDVAGSGTFERATSSLQEVARSNVLPPRSSFDPDTNLRFQGNFRVAQKLRILTGIYDVAGSGTFERATSSLQEVARSNVLPPRSSFDPDTNLRFQGNFRVAQKLRILTGIYDVAGSGTFERATSSLQEVARSNVLPPRSSFDPDTNLRFQGNFRVVQKLRILTGIYDVAGSGTFERATSSLQEVARSNVLPPRSSFDPDTNLRFQGNFRVAQKLRILTGIYDVAGSGTFERATSSLQEVARSNVLPPRSSFDPDTNLRFQGNFRVAQKLRILTGIYDVAGSGTFERATSSLQEVARSNVLPPRSSFDPDTNLRFQGNFRVAQKLRILTGIYDVAGSGTFERATSSLQEVARSNVLPPRSSFDPDTNLRFQGNFRVAQKLRILTGIYDVAGSGTFERATSSLQEVARSNVLPPRSSFDPDTNLRFQGNFRVAQKLRILTGIYDVAGSGTFERATSSLQEVARSNVLPPRSSFDPDTNLRFQGNFRVAQKLRILTGIYDVAGSGTFERATSSLQEVARSNVLPPRSSFDPDTNLRFQGNFRVAQKLRILTGIYDVAGSGTFERATSSLQEVARSNVLPPRNSFDPDTNLRFQGNFRVAQKLRILTGIYDVAGSGTFERATSSLVI
ncbi:LOW QUALITY PROTEIN: titin [Vespula squamosa]|uniref:Titin n=1 Tax=Vespula squamosa TaxID=30214 RepID=A0ABD2BMK1_VESSQ